MLLIVLYSTQHKVINHQALTAKNGGSKIKQQQMPKTKTSVKKIK